MAATTFGKEKVWRITGTVVDRKSGDAMPGLRLEVWDKDILRDDFLAKEDLAATGGFALEFHERDSWVSLLDHRPDLYFKIYRGQVLLWTTTVLRDIPPGFTEVIIEVDADSPFPNNSSHITLSAPKRFRLLGKVIDSATGLGMPNLRVDAWDDDLILDDWLGQSAATDAEGRYAIEFDNTRFRGWFGERYPDLFFKVYRGDDIILAATDPLLRNVGRPGVGQIGTDGTLQYEVDILVDTESADTATPLYRVKGSVRWLDGQPAVGVNVRAYDKALRGDSLLGQRTCKQSGLYEIHYRPVRSKANGDKSVNLFIRAFDAGGQELRASDVHFNAAALEKIDLDLFAENHRPVSEYENLIIETTPLLQGLALNELTPHDVDLLAGATGLDTRHLAWLAESARSHQQAVAILGKAPFAPFIFYGLFRQGLPTYLSSLLNRDPAHLRDALSTSVRQVIIPWLAEPDLDEITQQLRLLRMHLALRPEEQRLGCSLSDLLAVVPLSEDKQLVVAEIYLRHDLTLTYHEFSDELIQRPEFTPDEKDNTWHVLQLGRLTGCYLPLIVDLYATKPTARSSPLRDLARYTKEDWVRIIVDHRQPNGQPIGVPPHTVGASQEELASNYADTLLSYLTESMPTAVIAHALVNDTDSNSPFASSRNDLDAFFGHKPGIEFGSPQMFYQMTNPSQRAIAPILKTLQRLIVLTPKYAAIKALAADGLCSSMAIVGLGLERFSEKYSEVLGGAQTAHELFQRAARTHATALTAAMKYSPELNAISPYVISGNRHPTTPAALFFGSGDILRLKLGDGLQQDGLEEGYLHASLSTLFGSLNLCECPHCMSLCSPAAYLVYLLKHLDKQRVSETESALTYLLKRRLDLAFIEFTCDNTKTPMPYVDLVNEILERHCAERDFIFCNSALDPVDDIVRSLEQGEIHAALRAELEKSYVLTERASVRKDKVSDVTLFRAWEILDSAWVFWVGYESSKAECLRVFSFPQTSWTAAELSANPEHTHAPAYAVLRQAVYPWSLPMNLPVEEVRAYLGHLGLPRHQLIETFFPGDIATVWSDKTLAYEYLSLTREEAEIITGKTAGAPSISPAESGPWNFWGVSKDSNNIPDLMDGTRENATGSWDEVLQRVSVFLQKSGLSYKEMLDLLSTDFVNPDPKGEGRILGISSSVTTCNPSVQEIQLTPAGLSSVGASNAIAAALERCHRFTRLWRRLGWTAHDVDRAIATFESTEIDESLLVRLSHVQRLVAALGLPPIKVLSFWSTIDTSRWVDHQAAGQPERPSLYEQVFLNKAVIKPVHAAFELDGGQVELKVTAAKRHTKSPGSRPGSGPAKQAAAALIRYPGSGKSAKTPSTASDRIAIAAHASAISTALGIPDVALSALLDDLRVQWDDELNLANLSRLFRMATLAGALKLSPGEWLSVRRLTGIDPFESTESTLLFVEQVDRIRASGFSVGELDYLLRHQSSPGDGIAPNDSYIASMLSGMRNEIGRIVADNRIIEPKSATTASTWDPNGDLTRRKLALLNWDAALIEDVVATLNDEVIYETLLASLPFSDLANAPDIYVVDLASLPPGWAIPVAAVFYDEREHKLRAGRALTPQEGFLLTSAAETSGDHNLADSVKRLLDIQDQCRGTISYDDAAQKLRFEGVMTDARRQSLSKTDVNQHQSYHQAIEQLYRAPRDFAERYLRRFSLPDFKAALAALPADLSIPEELKNRVYFDSVAHKLHFVGMMSDRDLKVLSQLSSDLAYKSAVQALFAQVRNSPVASGDVFLTEAETNAMFANASVLSERFAVLLRRLLPYLSTTLSKLAVMQSLSEALKLDTKLTGELLERWLKSSGPDPTKTAISDFLDPQYTGGNSNLTPSRAAFPCQFATFEALHKIALVVSRLRLSGQQVEWLSTFGPTNGLLDLNTLVYSTQIGHSFHGKLDSDSTANWTVIPRQTGQSERSDAGLMGCTPRRLLGSSS